MRWGGLVLSFAALAACGGDPASPEPRETSQVRQSSEQADGVEAPSSAAPDAAAEAQLGTPMAERVATLGLLNKRNNLTQDIELKPGEEQQIGDVLLRVSACERTAPWEMPQETGAFVQVFVRGRGEEEFARVHSGWLFKQSPSVNVVEHPIYDVWVKDCAMSFPGDEAPSSSASESSEA